MEDDEECGDENEPSLGSLASGERSSQASWAAGNNDDLEDEHDGAEHENEHGDGNPDDEPSLGQTVDGCIGNTSSADCDAELQDHAPMQPQDRTDLGTGVYAESTYCKYLRGLTPEQHEAFKQAMRAGTMDGVLVRSD